MKLKDLFAIVAISLGTISPAVADQIDDAYTAVQKEIPDATKTTLYGEDAKSLVQVLSKAAGSATPDIEFDKVVIISSHTYPSSAILLVHNNTIVMVGHISTVELEDALNGI